MRWAVGETEVTWTAGVLDGPPHLLEDVEDLAAAGGILQPIPGTAIPAGLVDPLEAWATITVALADAYPLGAVAVPEPPESLAAEGEDRIY